MNALYFSPSLSRDITLFIGDAQITVGDVLDHEKEFLGGDQEVGGVKMTQEQYSALLEECKFLVDEFWVEVDLDAACHHCGRPWAIIAKACPLCGAI